MPYVLTLFFLAAALWLNHAAIALILGIALTYVIFIPKDFLLRSMELKYCRQVSYFWEAVSVFRK
ncbi:MAG: hypothetical protein Ct9H300mP20_01550 [Gammaproteobacteria bacterium]|nr:MAG: hypothetical protein Ct9H300mP20_01550 [Gammaproteobacteria bacterium]